MIPKIVIFRRGGSENCNFPSRWYWKYNFSVEVVLKRISESFCISDTDSTFALVKSVRTAQAHLKVLEHQCLSVWDPFGFVKDIDATSAICSSLFFVFKSLKNNFSS